jgi:hypothetical protein
MAVTQAEFHSVTTPDRCFKGGGGQDSNSKWRVKLRPGVTKFLSALANSFHLTLANVQNVSSTSGLQNVFTIKLATACLKTKNNAQINS